MVHHFSAGGLYDGLVLLIDDETKSYWNHITGQAVAGPLAGRQLPSWSLDYTTAGALVETEPTMQLKRSRPDQDIIAAMAEFGDPKIGQTSGLPEGFRGTMGGLDERLPEMAQGLGVVISTARFYPVSSIGDRVAEVIDGCRLVVEVGPDRVPRATWEDGSRPFQIFCRWYGFSLTYPGCSVLAEQAPRDT